MTNYSTELHSNLEIAPGLSKEDRKFDDEYLQFVVEKTFFDGVNLRHAYSMALHLKSLVEETGQTIEEAWGNDWPNGYELYTGDLKDNFGYVINGI